MSIALTVVDNGGGNLPDWQYFSMAAGEDVALVLSHSPATNVTGRTYRRTLSKDVDGPVYSDEDPTITTAATGVLADSIAANDTFSLPSGTYLYIVRRNDSGYNAVVCRAKVRLEANPLAGSSEQVEAPYAVAWVDISGKPTTLSGFGITDAQASDGTLTALASLNSTAGLVVQTGADTFAKRTLTAGTGISVTNGDGVSGAPTVAVDSSVVTLTGTQTLTNKTLGNGDNDSTYLSGGLVGVSSGGIPGGSLRLRAGSGSESSGGGVDVSGGSGASSNGGAFSAIGGSGDNAFGGDVNTHGGSANGANGGSFLSYGVTLPGGNVDTSDGGGSINTRGTGSIQLGVSGTRTTFTGAATADRAIALPDASGTVVLTTATQTISGKTLTFDDTTYITDGAHTSIDPYNRKLYASDGTLMFDWDDGSTQQWGMSSFGHAIKMNDGSGTGGGWLYMDSGKIVMPSGSVISDGTYTEIDPYNRKLYKSDGTTVAIDWQALDLVSSFTIGSAYIYRAGGTDVPVADGGTGASDAATARTNLGVVNNATHTGDVTGSTALTLATVNSNVGSFGSASAIPVITVNAKGLVTAVSTASVSGGANNIWVPASAMIPRVTNGPGVNSSEGGTNKANYDTLDFDTTTQEYAQFMTVMPSNYSGGTVTARFFWTADSGSGTVQFQLAGRALSDDDAIDTARGTAVGVSDTLLAAGDLHRTSATSAITIAGTPAANALVLFEVSRDVANDNLGVDARLIGVEVSF